MKRTTYKLKKFFIATAPVAVLVASVVPMQTTAHAEVAQQETIFYKAINEDGTWKQTDEVITSFDFSKYEQPLIDAGEEYDLELMNVNVKAVNTETLDEIDFGSFVDFKAENKDLLLSGNTYQFYLQGVYILMGENVDPDPITSDFTATDFVLVSGAPASDASPEVIAEEAVATAEVERTQASVDFATGKVDSLPDGSTKDELNARLETIQSELDNKALEKSAKQAVEDAETAKTQSSIDTAREAVSLLPSGVLKTELTDRLDALQAELDSVTDQDQAEQAVVKAETDKTQQSVDDAKTLVNALPNGVIKEGLKDRLDAVQTQIDRMTDEELAEKAVENAEANLTQKDLDIAKDLVNGLDHGEVKDSLIDRLDTIQADVNENEAKQSVVKAETDKTQSSLDSAKSKVDSLPEGALKEELKDRVEAVQAKLDAIKAVTDAESTKTQEKVDLAKDAVSKLPDGQLKNELNNRLDAVQEEINKPAPPSGGSGGSGTTTPVTPDPEKPKQEVVEPNVVVPPVVKPDEKTPIVNNDKVSVDLEVSETNPVTGNKDISVEVAPKEDMKDVTVTIVEKDKETSIKTNHDKFIGDVKAGEEVKVTVPVKDSLNKEYTVKIETPTMKVESGTFSLITAASVKFVYEDVPKTHWAESEIYKATKLGIVEGYNISDKHYFKPAESVTRAQAIVMVLRSLGVKYEGYKGEGFADSKGTWYESAVAKAKDLGLAVGYINDEFRGDDKIKRDHLAVFLSRAYLNEYIVEKDTFKDVPKTNWTYPHINALAEIGILSGYKDGTFKPNENTTRAQTISTIMRTLNSKSQYINLGKYKEQKVAYASTVNATDYDFITIIDK